LNSSDFGAVLRSGKKTNDPLFTVTTVPNSLQQARLGITVSRKVSKRAVIRNRIKRQVRESFRHNRQGLEGVSMVVIARQPAAISSNPELRDSLQKHWDRIKQQCRRS
jgi:ribonuclease P protein component